MSPGAYFRNFTVPRLSLNCYLVQHQYEIGSVHLVVTCLGGAVSSSAVFGPSRNALSGKIVEVACSLRSADVFPVVASRERSDDRKYVCASQARLLDIIGCIGDATDGEVCVFKRNSYLW